MVVLLHGYLSSKESFAYQIAFLKNFYRVIAPDLSGFGKSPPLTEPYSVSDYANEVIEFLNGLNVKSYNLIAHSFGARVAVKMLLNDERIKKVVLTGAAGIKPRRKPSYYIKVYAYKLLKKFIPETKLKNFGSSEYKTLSGVMKESYLKIVNEHLNGEYSRIKNQALIIFGENDRETPPYMAKIINKSIKNSKLIIMKNAGHFAFIDKSSEFNVYLLEFLKGGENVTY